MPILNIYNSYYKDDLEKDNGLLIYLINNCMTQNKSFTNCVNISEIDSFIYDEESYYLVMNYTSSSIPKKINNQGYLSKIELDEIDYPTDQEQNNYYLKHYESLLSTIKNLTLFFPQLSIEENRVSSLELSRNIIHKDYSYKINEITYLDSLNKLEYAKDRYDLSTYYIRSQNYNILNKYYHEDYQTYNHQYTGIRNNDLNKLLKKKNSLTGAKMESYNLCEFQFLLGYLLNLDQFESTMALYLGNLTHKVLEEFTINENIDWISIVDGFTGIPLEEQYKEKVYKEAIKFELNRLLPIIKDFHNMTFFNKLKPETKFKFPFPLDNNFDITGTIDKVMVYEADNQTQYIALIDYKLGNKDFKMDKFDTLQQLQLPVYLYAYKNISDKSVKPVGFYYQTTNIGRYNKEPNIIKKNFQLAGISLQDKSLLEKLTPGLEMIKGVRVKNDGDLTDMNNGRLVTEDTFKEIYDTVEEQFSKMIAKLKTGSFNINPVPAYGSQKDSVSCEYCKFAHICYNKNTKVEEEYEIY
jgi:ATP-dependent helicase/DNAse subunit B